METTIHDIARQVDWEEEGIARAVERYETMEFGVPARGGLPAKPPADPTTLPPGMALMKGVVKPLVAEIEAQQQAIRAMFGTPTRQQAWATPLLILNPTTTAVVVLSTAVRAVVVRDGSALASVTACAIKIAECLQDQIAFEKWEQEQLVANKAAKKAKDSTHKDLLRALRLDYPNLEARTWRKWEAKLALARDVEWEKRLQIELGTALLHMLLKVAPERFFLDERRASNGVQYTIGLKPEVLEVMADVRERALVSRPRHMPMIIPPLPWRYEERLS